MTFLYRLNIDLSLYGGEFCFTVGFFCRGGFDSMNDCVKLPSSTGFNRSFSKTLTLRQLLSLNYF